MWQDPTYNIVYAFDRPACIGTLINYHQLTGHNDQKNKWGLKVMIAVVTSSFIPFFTCWCSILFLYDWLHFVRYYRGSMVTMPNHSWPFPSSTLTSMSSPSIRSKIMEFPIIVVGAFQTNSKCLNTSYHPKKQKIPQTLNSLLITLKSIGIEMIQNISFIKDSLNTLKINDNRRCELFDRINFRNLECKRNSNVNMLCHTTIFKKLKPLPCPNHYWNLHKTWNAYPS